MGHSSSECMCVLSSYYVFPTVMGNYTSPQLPYLYVYVCVLSSLSVFPTVMGNHTSPQLPYLNVCLYYHHLVSFQLSSCISTTPILMLCVIKRGYTR